MLHDSNVTEYSLAPGALIAIHRHAGLFITADAGTLWITEPGTGDIVLQPGEQYRSAAHGKLVIEALTPARLHVGPGTARQVAHTGAVRQSASHSVGQPVNSSQVHGGGDLCGAN